MTDDMGPTKPAAGVMATRPATAPEAIPKVVGLPLMIHSMVIQLKAAAAVAICVTTKAMAAPSLADSALPALNPNQPNHSSPAPNRVSVRLCGIIAVDP